MDPNNWVGDLIDAVRQEFSFTGWVTSDGAGLRCCWGKPNCHVRKRMSTEDREDLQAQWAVIVNTEVTFSDPDW